MIFNSHILDSKNFHKAHHMKKQIIIGNTYSNGLNHVVGWKNRFNGNYKTTAPITILRNGDIHHHYDPKYYSEFMGIKHIDKYSIPIVLENLGWLTKDLQNDKYLTWIGDIYNGEDEVIEKRWRNHKYWTSYTDEQLNSLVETCKKLCIDFEIPLKTMTHNTYVSSVENVEGIIYKGNFSKYYTDVNPTFEFDKFKNKLEVK